MSFINRVLTALTLGSLMTTPFLYAAESSPTITVGTQEVGLAVGYILPHRLTEDHITRGPGLHALMDDHHH
ncbi:MAG: hypothetical protein HZB34_05760 [Nitrospirae bacterium]|nr:hypothetical protein [Nitrospirota bacterium]